MLTDAAARNAQATDGKAIKLFDEKGLYLLVMPNGRKGWRVKYRFGGRPNLLSVGVYPEVSLKEAREGRDTIRQQIRAGINPSAQRKAIKVSQAGADTFEVIAREWHERRAAIWASEHADRVLRLLERDVFPWIGSRPIGSITAPVLLDVLRRIEARCAHETAHRALQASSQVFRFAIVTGRGERDPAADLRGALTPVKVTHFPAITDPKAIGDLLRAIEGYQGSFITRCALQLAPRLMVRPGELRAAEWAEFDIDAAEWRIPGPRMKMRQEHLVPLSRQAIVILKDLNPLTGTGQYLFPGLRTATRQMSENTVNAALRRLGYRPDQMTGHGFRTMASTLLHEQGWPSDAIERQLAHTERNKVKGSYNRAEHLAERRQMMQSWSDYLDGLKAGATVIPIQRQHKTR